MAEPFRHLALLGVVAASLTAGCSETEREATPGSVDFFVDSTGSFPIARNAGQPPVWSIEPIGTVGDVGFAAEPSPDEFGRVASVTPGPDEGVWIADRYASRIKVFRPDGTLQLEIGGSGQGPGEFSSLYSVAWVGDILLALDLGNGRIAEISPDGSWLGTRPAPGRVSGRPALLRFRPNPLQSCVIELTAASTSSPFHSVHRSCKHPQVGALTYEAWSSQYRFAVIDPEGDTLLAVERSWPDVAVSDEAWETATAEFTAFRSESPDASCTPRTMRRPASRAPIRALLLDTQGRVWVEAVRGKQTRFGRSLTPPDDSWPLLTASTTPNSSPPRFEGTLSLGSEQTRSRCNTWNGGA